MNEREHSSGGAAAALLVGTALGGAALLLSTPQGKQWLAQTTDFLTAWIDQTSAAIAETREKIVSAVESQTPDDPQGRVRENR